ncbi:HigA family addiction module antitoxin [Chryseobacterium sp. HMWF035]|uniref:HigA family addiction module antitoxin n=1 Tax=Chryseobacterium sp. HMWF035 TaxID=2056868 RepID=UPI000D56F5B3|nr:HigA family addiction module antitoxin [Chryseobacterium sp. HMWF035]PVV56292.1 addiction module antidote protein, HigA family [Chryseobacterium sp. HMWF035]
MKPLVRVIKHNTHPGEILNDLIIEPNNLNIEEASKLLGITKATLSDIINGKGSITNIIATSISKAFGGSSAFWVRLQAVYNSRKGKETEEKESLKVLPDEEDDLFDDFENDFDKSEWTW